MQPPLHVIIAPPIEGGAERRQGWCGRTPGAPAPDLAPLATAFAWQAPGWAWTKPRWVSHPNCLGKLGLLLYSVAQFCNMLL
jgi:hypothetical protein